MILSSSFDRPNVYQQTQRLRSRVDVWYAKYDFRKRDLDPKDASATKNKTSSNASTGFYSSQPVMWACSEECQTLEKCICSLTYKTNNL